MWQRIEFDDARDLVQALGEGKRINTNPPAFFGQAPTSVSRNRKIVGLANCQLKVADIDGQRTCGLGGGADLIAVGSASAGVRSRNCHGAFGSLKD